MFSMPFNRPYLLTYVSSAYVRCTSIVTYENTKSKSSPSIERSECACDAVIRRKTKKKKQRGWYVVCWHFHHFLRRLQSIDEILDGSAWIVCTQREKERERAHSACSTTHRLHSIDEESAEDRKSGEMRLHSWIVTEVYYNSFRSDSELTKRQIQMEHHQFNCVTNLLTDWLMTIKENVSLSKQNKTREMKCMISCSLWTHPLNWILIVRQWQLLASCLS